MSTKSRTVSSKDEVIVIAMICALWLVAVGVSILGMVRMERYRGALHLIGDHSIRLSQAVSRIDLWQAELVSLMPVLGDADKEVGKVAAQIEHHELLTDTDVGIQQILKKQTAEIHQLKSALELIHKDPDHIAQKDLIGDSLRVVSELEVMQIGFARKAESFLKDGQASVDDEQSLVKEEEIRRRGTEVDRKISAVTSLVNKLSGEAIRNTEERQQAESTEYLLIIAAMLIFGLLLVFQVRAFQKRLVRSEKMAVLGATTITLHHEINNPLAVILGNSYLLQNQKLPDAERQRCIESISEMAEQIGKVVKKIGEIEEISVKDYLPGEPMLDIFNSKIGGQEK